MERRKGVAVERRGGRGDKKMARGGKGVRKIGGEERRRGRED